MNWYLFLWLISPLIALLLDLAVGDPSPFHPVALMGRLIGGLAKTLRSLYGEEPKNLRKAGARLVVLVCLITFLTYALLIFGAALINRWVALAVHILLSAQLFACNGLGKAALNVKKALENDDLPGARELLGHLVGRKTDALSQEEIVNGAVESVAENLTDAVIAPAFWLIIGGVPLMAVYKAVNTMDSMIGYTTQTHVDFGRTAALTDDVLNYLPARCAGVLAVVSAALLPGFSGREAKRTFVSDRMNHLSPNSAQTESAFAGALNLRLGGSHTYFGETVNKPLIGAGTDRPTPQMIGKSVIMMRVSSLLFLTLSVVGCLLIGFLTGELLKL
ncbi:MAG: adenosylcobinamide-phosphate synthase CbiB [Fastidiosipilaceae bacterium]|jgi:adenosylcobinamide-phosphate synthase